MYVLYIREYCTLFEHVRAYTFFVRKRTLLEFFEAQGSNWT